jgi:hypothetical protein
MGHLDTCALNIHALTSQFEEVCSTTHISLWRERRYHPLDL